MNQKRTSLSHCHRPLGHVSVRDVSNLLSEAGLTIIESGPVGMLDLQFVLAKLACCVSFTNCVFEERADRSGVRSRPDRHSRFRPLSRFLPHSMDCCGKSSSPGSAHAFRSLWIDLRVPQTLVSAIVIVDQAPHLQPNSFRVNVP